MKLIITITFILIISLASSLAAAEVSLKLNGYNSQDSVSSDMNGQNLNDAASLYLDSQNIIFGNSGASNSKDGGYYSFSFKFNDYPQYCWANVVPGAFSWKAKVAPTWGITSPDETFTLEGHHFVCPPRPGGGDNNQGSGIDKGSVADEKSVTGSESVTEQRSTNEQKYGMLVSGYGNGKTEVENSVKVFDAIYNEQINMDANKVESSMSGSTPPADVSEPKKKEPEVSEVDLSQGLISMSNTYIHVESGPSTQEFTPNVDHSTVDSPTVTSPLGIQTSGERGFIQKIKVENNKDWSQITAAAFDDKSDISLSWTGGVSGRESDISLGLAIQGLSGNPPQELQMVGVGSDIPPQYLPPGKVKIDYKTATELELEQYKQYALAQKDAFYEDYPNTETTNEPWTWYYIKQDVFDVSAEEDNSQEPADSTSGTPELFQMMMGFYMDGE
jgi:hypothetical protein